MRGRPRVYLAGPDVFLPHPEAIAEAKRRLCDKYGFFGVSPIDNEIDLGRLPPRETAFAISSANEQMIRECDLVVANLTPFRSASADVGTVFELGFARGLRLPIFAYTNTAGTLLEKSRDLLHIQISQRASAPPGTFEDEHGMVIENFGLADNLMLEGGLHGSGSELIVSPAPPDRRFTDLSGFERCLQQAAAQLSKPG